MSSKLEHSSATSDHWWPHSKGTLRPASKSDGVSLPNMPVHGHVNQTHGRSTEMERRDVLFAIEGDPVQCFSARGARRRSAAGHRKTSDPMTVRTRAHVCRDRLVTMSNVALDRFCVNVIDRFAIRLSGGFELRLQIVRQADRQIHGCVHYPACCFLVIWLFDHSGFSLRNQGLSVLPSHCLGTLRFAVRGIPHTEMGSNFRTPSGTEGGVRLCE